MQTCASCNIVYGARDPSEAATQTPSLCPLRHRPKRSGTLPRMGLIDDADRHRRETQEIEAERARYMAPYRYSEWNSGRHVGSKVTKIKTDGPNYSVLGLPLTVPESHRDVWIELRERLSAVKQHLDFNQWILAAPDGSQWTTSMSKSPRGGWSDHPLGYFERKARDARVRADGTRVWHRTLAWGDPDDIPANRRVNVPIFFALNGSLYAYSTSPHSTVLWGEPSTFASLASGLFYRASKR